MAQLVIKNTGATAVLFIPVGTIRGWLSTVCTSSSEIADGNCSRAFLFICCAYSMEKHRYLQLFKCPRYRKENIPKILNVYFFCFIF